MRKGKCEMKEIKPNEKSKQKIIFQNKFFQKESIFKKEFK